MSSLPEASLESLELGLRNVNIHNGKCDGRIPEGYLSSSNKVSMHNGEGMHMEEAEEEEEEDEDDIEADILRQSGYSSSIKKPSNQPMPVKEDVEEEEEEEDDIEADILRQSGYSSTMKKQPMPTMEDEEDDDDEEEEDDITTDILKQSGYGSMKKPTRHSKPKTAAAPVKLVSALRGSREKEGAPTKIMSVTWSPEVYDPIPSAETFVRIKKPRLKSDSKKVQELKKNGKPIGKDKGKASKSGGGGGSSSSKDKKSKYSNNSKRSYGSFDNDD